MILRNDRGKTVANEPARAGQTECQFETPWVILSLGQGIVGSRRVPRIEHLFLDYLLPAGLCFYLTGILRPAPHVNGGTDRPTRPNAVQSANDEEEGQ